MSCPTVIGCTLSIRYPAAAFCSAFTAGCGSIFPDAPGRNFSKSCPAGALPSAGNVAGDQLKHKQQEPLRMEKLLLFVFCMSRNFLLFR